VTGGTPDQSGDDERGAHGVDRQGHAGSVDWGARGHVGVGLGRGMTRDGRLVGP
jgi:hypothetical protein